MPLIIRPVTSLDIDDLLPLVEAYRAFYKQPANPATRQYVVDRIESGEAIAFMAKLEKRAIGFTLCYPTFSTVAVAPIWLLNDLYVDDTYRKQGIASALVAAAEQAARDAGAARIWLRTAQDNTKAQRLYEKRGWKHDEVFRRYDLIF
jgi:GNAT superfamily N-acetyltransferase